jgi:hypothetical protein
MLREARARLDERGIRNVALVVGDDALSQAPGPYDLIHSVIVFQHIPVRRGEAIVREMLARMRQGSVGVLHFTYAHSDRSGLRGRWKTMREQIGHWLASLRGRPRMQMNDYSLSRLFAILQHAGITRTHVELADHAGILGATLYFQLHRTV